MALQENEVSYYLDTGVERLYIGSCTLEETGENFKLGMKATDKSDGLIITIKNIKTLSPQKLYFNKEVNIIVNEKIDKELNIYVSSGCKDSEGTVEILEWDKEDKTITGVFSGPVCTRGIFAHLPDTKINQGAFYKLKYHVK